MMKCAVMRRGIHWVAASCLVAFAAGRVEADTIYLTGTTSGQHAGDGVLAAFNTTNNTFSDIGYLGGPGNGNNVVLADIGFTSGGTLYGADTVGDSLYSITTSNANVQKIGTGGKLVANLTALGGDGLGNLLGAVDNQIYTVSTTDGTTAKTSNKIGGAGTTIYAPIGDLTTFNGVTYVTAGRNASSDTFLLSIDSTGLGTVVSDLGNKNTYNFVGLASGADSNGINQLYAFTSSGTVYELTSTLTGGSVGSALTTSGSISAYTYTGAASGPTFSPTIVPEPSSLVLCGLAGLVGLGYYRRKGKRNAA